MRSSLYSRPVPFPVHTASPPLTHQMCSFRVSHALHSTHCSLPERSLAGYEAHIQITDYMQHTRLHERLRGARGSEHALRPVPKMRHARLRSSALSAPLQKSNIGRL